MQTEHSFSGSLRIQFRVIGALLMREIITRYGRDNLGFLWLFVEPMIFTIGVTVLWTMLSLHETFSLPIVAFAVTGYSTVLLWRNCAARCSWAINPNLGLLHHRNVKVLDLFITRILLEVAGASISFFVLSVLWISLEWMAPPVDLFAVLVGWICLAWYSAGLGLIVGSATAYSPVAERLWHPISYFLFPISGAVFMVDWLPASLQGPALWVPMVNAVEILRAGFFGPLVRTHYDLELLLIFCMVMTLIGLVMVRDAARRVESQ